MQDKHIVSRLIGFMLFASLFVAQPAVASDYLSDDWQFTLAPYMWALSVKGDTTVKGATSKIDMGFGDVWDNLNFALMVQTDARKGRIGMFVNPFLSQLESKSSLIDISIDLNMVSFGAYYRLGPWDLTQDPGITDKVLVVDLYAGGRYTYVNIELDGQRIDEEGSKDWVDPIIGLRSFWSLSPQWTIALAGDVGGFGVGSDFAWQATGVVGYGLELMGDDNAQFFAGYRIISQDYETGSGDNKFAWDIDLKGPTVGLAYHF